VIDAEVREDATGLPFLREKHQPGVARHDGTERYIGVAIEPDPALRGAIESADECQEEIGATRANQPGEADDLAAAHRERDVVQSIAAGPGRITHGKAFDRKEFRRGRRDGEQRAARDLPTAHQAHHLVFAESSRRPGDHVPAIAQNSDPVREAPDLVELV
jgi:hypothetical protein